jgi:nitroreductase
MNIKETIKKRRSVRAFQMWKEVPGLTEAITLARRAPTAGGIRGYRAYITKEPIGPYGAPVYIVICADQSAYEKRYGDRGMNLYAIQDATIYAAYLQLILTDMGLATCWIGAFNEERIKGAIGIAELKPVVILAVGFAQDE